MKVIYHILIIICKSKKNFLFNNIISKKTKLNTIKKIFLIFVFGVKFIKLNENLY